MASKYTLIKKMNNLLDVIKETVITEEFKIIDAEIVCESLNCKLLQDLARQLKDIKNEKQEKIEKKYKEEVEKYGSDHVYKDSNYNKTFKQIFGGDYGIRWDKISDSDIVHIPATDEFKPKDKKELMSVIKSSSKNIALIKDKEDKEFLYVIYTWGYVFRLTNKDSYGRRTDSGSRVRHEGYRTSKDLTNKEKFELCQGNNIYLIDVSNKVEGNKLKTERYAAKSGIVMFDPDSLKKIAEQNIERYKKILREKRAKNLNNDELINKCKKIINQVASYATMIAKDPVRHADLISDVSLLSTYIYDKKRYHQPDRYNKKGYYYGVNGLLPMLMKYTDLVKTLSSGGGYDFQNKDLKEVQNNMKESVEKAEELLKKIEDKINE